jgi:hypothetical protein
MGQEPARHVPEGVFRRLLDLLGSGVRNAVDIENRYAEITEPSKQTVQRSLVGDGPMEPRAPSLGPHVESFEPLGPVVVQGGADDDLVVAAGERICHGSTV